MSSPSLVLVLLFVGCFWSFTEAQSGQGIGLCCFTYQSSAIPSKHVIEYKKTQLGCPKPGVIFVLKNDQNVCVDPGKEWVQAILKKKDAL